MKPYDIISNEPHRAAHKPAVYIYENNATAQILKEICAGLEEEGVLYAISSKENVSTPTLAYAAANHSPLQVGIGITAHAAALHMRNCPAERPVFTLEAAHASPQDYRKLGTNAARAVKGGRFV